MRSSSFYINIIACTQPFFTVAGCQSFPDFKTRRRTEMIILQLPRMMRMALFMPQFNSLKSYYAEKRGMTVNDSQFRMGIIFFFILLTNTLLSCVYYAMGHTKAITDASTSEDTNFFCVQNTVRKESSVVLHLNDAAYVGADTWVITDPQLYPSCSVDFVGYNSSSSSSR